MITNLFIENPFQNGSDGVVAEPVLSGIHETETPVNVQE